MEVLATQPCLALCDPMDSSPPGPSVHGISQAVILEWVATCFCRGSSWPRGWNQVSCIGREQSKPPGKPMETQNFRSKHWQAEQMELSQVFKISKGEKGARLKEEGKEEGSKGGLMGISWHRRHPGITGLFSGVTGREDGNSFSQKSAICSSLPMEGDQITLTLR